MGRDSCAAGQNEADNGLSADHPTSTEATLSLQCGPQRHEHISPPCGQGKARLALIITGS